MSGDHFDRARKVFLLARLEAVRHNHDYLDAEHILLGLLIEDGGIASKVLEKLGVDLNKARSEVENRLKPGPAADLSQKGVPFTPRAKKCLEFAIDEACTLHHNDVGSEHLLLGLVRENNGLAAKVLLSPAIRRSGEALTLEVIRNEVKTFLGK